MAEAVAFSKHLTHEDLLDHVRKTQIGQAHFAGTGPYGRTCRECKHFYCKNREGEPAPFRYRGDENEPSSPDKVTYLQPALCNFPIPNKAEALISHSLEACRHFEECSTPPSETRKDQRYKVNRSE